MRYLSLILVVALAFSCSKNLEEAPNNSVTDSVTVRVERTRNAIDSFTINAGGNWTITPQSNASWIELSTLSGNGTTHVQVTSIQANNFPTERTATFVVTNTDNATEIYKVTVVQEKYEFSSWTKLFGGTGWDMLLDITATPDGGYIAVGNSASTDGDVSANNGENDVWVVKLDAAGEIEWQKNYGDVFWDGASKIVATDGGYAILAVAEYLDGNVSKQWIIKIDDEGTVTWDKSFEGTTIYTIVSVPSGGLICSGTKNQDAFLLRLDNNGSVTWSKTYGGALLDRAYGVDVTSDGGFIASGNYNYPSSGTTDDYISQNTWIFKVDANGEMLWEKNHGGSNIEWGYQVLTMDDGGAIVVSTTESDDVQNFHGFYDVMLTKVDANGDLVWQKAYGTSSFEFAHGFSRIDGGIIFSAQIGEIVDGDLDEAFGQTDAWVVKVDGATGNIAWKKSFGASAIDVFTGISVANNKVVMTGHSASAAINDAIGHGDIDGYMQAIEMP